MAASKTVVDVLSDEEGTTLETAIMISSSDDDNEKDDDDKRRDSSCPICWDVYDRRKSKRIVLPTSCQYCACKGCLCKWWSTEEETGQDFPTCPLDGCSSSISSNKWKFVKDILGRPFTPAGTSRKKTNNKKKTASNSVKSSGVHQESEEQDSKWLKKHKIVQCGGCDTYISKESGCNKVQCICGYRICWKCKKVGSVKCNCTGSHHVFYDNLTHQPSFASRKRQIPKEKLIQHIKKKKQQLHE